MTKCKESWQEWILLRTSWNSKKLNRKNTKEEKNDQVTMCRAAGAWPVCYELGVTTKQRSSINNLWVQSHFPICHWPVHVADLVMQSQEWHWWLNGLPALGTQPDNLQSSLVNLFRQLINSNVTGSTHQDWSANVRKSRKSCDSYIKYSCWNNRSLNIKGFFKYVTVKLLCKCLTRCLVGTGGRR